MKDAETRLRQTIQFIRSHQPPIFVGDFKGMVDALEIWYKNKDATTRNKLSTLMSQAKAKNRPQRKEDRAYRRAVILLKCWHSDELKWPEVANFVSGVKEDFQDFYYGDLGLSRDIIYSSSARATTNLQLLRSNPQQFLERYKLIVNGKPSGQRYSYGFYMEEGAYWLDCITPSKAKVQVDAINVPATPFTAVQHDLGNIQATLSSVDTTCDLMLTTQFTGCCYCFMVNGTSLAAAHIDPQGKKTGITGQQISAQLRDHGGFSNGNGGTFKAYGRVPVGSDLFGYPQTAHQMIIVAVKSGTNWGVYAQIDLGEDRHVQRID
jgi:hypothetical protein